MNPLVWKRLREKKSPVKLISVTLVLAGLMSTYGYLFRATPENLFWSMPLAVNCVVFCFMFSVDDVAQPQTYGFMGFRMRDLWHAGVVTISCLSVIASAVVLACSTVSFGWDLQWTLIPRFFMAMPVLILLNELSTIHYDGYTQRLIITSSVFSLTNLAMVAAPLAVILLGTPGYLSQIVVGTASAIAALAIYVSFGRNSMETMLSNTDKYSGIYDRKMLDGDNDS